MIILLTNKYDISVDYIVRLLRQRNESFLRINSEDLIEQPIEISLPNFSINAIRNGNTIELSKNLKSILFRRPGKPFEFNRTSKPSLTVTKYLENQWHTFLESLCVIENALWINVPLKNHQAENKILQLKKAFEIGFNIPLTCVTSSKATALEFAEKCGQQIIAKALCAPLVEYAKKDFFIFATKINSLDEIPDIEFQLAPTIFQEAINEKVDYRVTIIGSFCFAVRIDSPDNSLVPLDWRLSKKRLKYIPVTLPSEVENKCLRLVKDLGLVFGAIDLVESNGKFYFLEINPNGEWGWLQKEAKLPIAETLTDFLIRGNVKNE
jgi:glutathione synthase/RimK-type ligase-like ATP-grasp enzyme